MFTGSGKSTILHPVAGIGQAPRTWGKLPVPRFTVPMVALCRSAILSIAALVLSIIALFCCLVVKLKSYQHFSFPHRESQPMP